MELKEKESLLFWFMERLGRHSTLGICFERSSTVEYNVVTTIITY